MTLGNFIFSSMTKVREREILAGGGMHDRYQYSEFESRVSKISKLQKINT